MQLSCFQFENQIFVGVYTRSNQTLTPFVHHDLDCRLGVVTVIEYLNQHNLFPPLSLHCFNLSQVKLLAPIFKPKRNIFCVGKNYLDHVNEMALMPTQDNIVNNSPVHPIFFSKLPQTVVGPGETILSHTNLTQALDYEAELAVIIGKPGYKIKAQDAMNYVFGYTIINDITARDLQRKHSQWFIGKNLDTFCPMGPWLSTQEELDLNTTEIKCFVNNELRQCDTPANLIFGVGQLIETLSAGITLYPGDIISTGTPAGVGAGMIPPQFLKSGDKVRAEISNIGFLENTIK